MAARSRPAVRRIRPRSRRRADPMRSLRKEGLIVLLALALGTSVAPAASPTGKVPRLANDKPDLSGLWQTLSAADYDLEPHSGRKDAPPGPGVVEGGALPYLPKALEQRRKNFAARATQDPARKCWALGVPRQVYYPEPFQIL